MRGSFSNSFWNGTWRRTGKFLITPPNLGETRRFFGGVVPLVGNECLSHMARGTSFFILFIDTVVFEPSFGHWKN